jgi:hypothetical protein
MPQATKAYPSTSSRISVVRTVVTGITSKKTPKPACKPQSNGLNKDAMSMKTTKSNWYQ